MEYIKPYNIDLVFCIDASSSMQPFMDKVKSNALNIVRDVRRSFLEHGRFIGRLRVRCIVFRSYQDSVWDLKAPMMVTDFYSLPEQQEQFERALFSITPTGGGELGDGLEALALAIRSKWTADIPGSSRLQIVIDWSDKGTNKIGTGRTVNGYLLSMPRDFRELSQWWGMTRESPGAFINYDAKRLLIFAPEADWWTKITENWPNVLHVPTVDGIGLKDRDYEEVIRLLTCTDICTF